MRREKPEPQVQLGEQVLLEPMEQLVPDFLVLPANRDQPVPGGQLVLRGLQVLQGLPDLWELLELLGLPGIEVYEVLLELQEVQVVLV